MLLDMGRRLFEKGIIDEVNDVFFLYEKELMTFFDANPSLKELNENVTLNGTIDLKDKISERKNEFYRYKSSLPPKFIKNGIEFDDTIMKYDEKAVYGAAASPGTFKALPECRIHR
jgi:pyruvate,water dikinase